MFKKKMAQAESWEISVLGQLGGLVGVLKVAVGEAEQERGLRVKRSI